MKIFISKLIIILYTFFYNYSNVFATTFNDEDLSTAENRRKYNIHDTPESRKSGQTWYNCSKENRIKYTYFLNESLIDGTIAVCPDSTTEQYHIELCFFVCASLSKEECDSEIKKHTSRFHDFQPEYKPEVDTGLFSAYLVKTERAGSYEAVNQFIPPLLAKYNLSYINTTTHAATEKENITPLNIHEDIVSETDITTQASSLSTNRSYSPENDHNPKKKQRLDTLVTDKPKAKKRDKKVKTIKQVKGQKSILSFIQKYK